MNTRADVCCHTLSAVTRPLKYSQCRLLALLLVLGATGGCSKRTHECRKLPEQPA